MDALIPVRKSVMVLSALYMVCFKLLKMDAAPLMTDTAALIEAECVV